MGIDGSEIKKERVKAEKAGAKVQKKHPADEFISPSKKKKGSSCISVFIVLFIGGLLAGYLNNLSHKVTAADFGKSWPFYTNEAYLYCDGIAPLAKVNGIEYALTGHGQGRGYPPVDAVWRDNPDNPGGKIVITPLRKAAEKYCNEL